MKICDCICLCMCVHVYVCVRARCCLHNSLPVSAHSSALTVHSSPFTSPLCLTPPPFLTVLLHIFMNFMFIMKTYAWKWRVGRGEKKQKQQKKNKQGECWWGVLSCLAAALHRQPSPLGTFARRLWFHLPFHFISFPFSFSFHPPISTTFLRSFLTFVPSALVLPPQLPWCLSLLVSPSRCQSQLQAEELSFLNNLQVD